MLHELEKLNANNNKLSDWTELSKIIQEFQPSSDFRHEGLTSCIQCDWVFTFFGFVLFLFVPSILSQKKTFTMIFFFFELINFSEWERHRHHTTLSTPINRLRVAAGSWALWTLHV